MRHLVLHHKPENRLITYGELVPAMSMKSVTPCGLVYADGIVGDTYAIRIGDMDNPVLFHDEQSVANAILHLGKDMDIKEGTFEIRPIDGPM